MSGGISKNFIPDEPWELNLGKDVSERTSRIGRDLQDYRQETKMKGVHPDRMASHAFFMHKLGADVLRSMFSEEHEAELERQAALKKQSKVVELIRKKIKVSDMDDGGVSIAIEQDWNTSSWNDAQVEAACEALLFIFYDLSEQASLERKERAVLMLQKLIQRHSCAEVFLRKNLEMIVGKAASKLIRKGVSGSILNLFYVINSCKDRYLAELSNFAINGKILEMQLQEARFAAILIQHTFRCQMSKKRLLQTKHLWSGFGTDKEVYYRQLRMINSRSDELRKFWRGMHQSHSVAIRKQCGGMRGPIHVAPMYTELCLDIMRYLTSEQAGRLAQSNREDCIRGKGCILFSTFLGCTSGRFAYSTALIMSEIAKTAESIIPLIQSGCIHSSIQFVRYLRVVHGLGTEVVKAKKDEKIPAITAYIAALDVLIHICNHMAGLYRAKTGFGYIKQSLGNTEMIDYRLVFTQLTQSQTVEKLIASLYPQHLLKELSTIVLTAQQRTVLLKSMSCFLALLASDCHAVTMLEVTAMAGKLMVQLLQFLHHDDEQVAMLAMAIFVLLCSQSSSRQSMMRVNISKYLLPMNRPGSLFANQQANNSKKTSDNSRSPSRSASPSKSYTLSPVKSSTTNGNNNSTINPALYNQIIYEHSGIRRSLFLTVLLSRQHDWRLYDPEVWLANAFHQFHNNSLSSWTRQIMMLDYLQTIKDRAYDGIGQGGSFMTATSASVSYPFAVADLVILPSIPDLELTFSKALSAYNAVELVHFFIHPSEEFYYETLSLEETVATVVLVEALASFAYTARMIFSAELTRFLAKVVFLCKYVILGDKKMYARQIYVILHGVKATFVALSRLCVGITEQPAQCLAFLEMCKTTELLTTTYFFLNAYAELDMKLPEEILMLQKALGLSVIDFLRSCAQVIIAADGDILNQPAKDLTKSKASNNNKESSSINNNKTRIVFEDLFPSAALVNKLLFKLKDLFPERTPQMKAEFLRFHETMLLMLCEMTSMRIGAYNALREWDVQTTLRFYLPPPITGIDLIPITLLNAFYSRKGEDSISAEEEEQKKARLLQSFEQVQGKEMDNKPPFGPDFRLELVELSPTFFQLCSNLCQMEEGIGFCFTDGFVRRALEKLLMLQIELLQSIGQYGALSKSYPWELRKVDFAACLRLLKCTANYARQKEGSVNDVLLHELYDLMGICKTVLTLKVRRQEEAYLLAWEVIAQLARDTYRVSPLMERYHVFELLRDEFTVLFELPMRGAEAGLDIIHFACVGHTTPYIIRMIPLLREPLLKVARVYAMLDDKVRRANWTLTKSAMIYRTTVDPTYLVEDSVQLDIEDFVRSGKPLPNHYLENIPIAEMPKGGVNNSLAQDDISSDAMSMPSSTASFKTATTHSKHTGNSSSPQKHVMDTTVGLSPIKGGVDSPQRVPANAKFTNDKFEMDDWDADINIHTTGKEAGSYSHCGISSCGSLRFPDNPHGHGHFNNLTTAQSMSMSLKLPAVDTEQDVLPISKLSAREPGLKEIVEYRKGKSGFSEIKKITLHPMRSPQPSPLSKKSKQHSTPQSMKELSVMSSSMNKMDIAELGTIQMRTISLQELPDLILTRPPPK